MSDNARRLANKKTRGETGLDYVVGALNLLTPFGTKLIKEQKPFFPGQEEELRAELERVQRMADIAAANEREISVLQETFMMMKDNSFTIERSARAALSVVEIFEVKSLLLLIEKVRKTADKVLLPEEFVPGDVTDLLEVLDPGKDRLNTFYRKRRRRRLPVQLGWLRRRGQRPLLQCLQGWPDVHLYRGVLPLRPRHRCLSGHQAAQGRRYGQPAGLPVLV